MSRIDFYLLSSSDLHSRRVTACRLIEKAYRQGHTVFLKTTSEEETQLFDNLLWTFRQGSFVPHEIHPAEPLDVPVVIGHGAPPAAMRDVLVNLAAELPDDFDQFERIAELVDQDETVKVAGRQRYKRYQELGHSLHTHPLDQGD
ncbi:MAG: DNA polymerase III subunit chi [Methylococcaceae bacterium]|jgi:DNA polymerase-3 subunit chi